MNTEFYAQAADRPAGRGIPGERLAITPERVARTIMAVLSRPRWVAYVPGWLRVVPWVEPAFGWLIDRLGPALLRRWTPSQSQAGRAQCGILRTASCTMPDETTEPAIQVMVERLVEHLDRLDNFLLSDGGWEQMGSGSNR